MYVITSMLPCSVVNLIVPFPEPSFIKDAYVFDGCALTYKYPFVAFQMVIPRSAGPINFALTAR